MFDINKYGMITMNRGDSWQTEIFVNIGTELQPIGYHLDEGEYVYFGVMEPNQPFEHALIRKRIDMSSASEDMPTGYYNIGFEVEDTEFLMPGHYYYEVKLLRKRKDSEGVVIEDKFDVDTIIPKTKFVIYE